MSQTMKSIAIARQGDPVAENIIIEDAPRPIPGPGEVLVKTEASSLNHLDLWVGRGLPGIDRPFPRIGGSDGAGTIEAVGPGVDPSWTDVRVVLNAAMPKPDPVRPESAPAPDDVVMIGEHVPGTLAEYFVAPVSNVYAIGDLAAPTACAAALTHLTAWRMLVSRAQLRAGQTVLIPGIGGGVALAALNIARHFGCRTIVTSRHQWKLDRAIELGADDAVHDTGDDWSRAVRGLTGKRGVDICADSIGKATHLFGVKALARGGTYVTCGCTTGPDATTDLARIFWNQLSILGSTMGDMDEFRAVMSLVVKGSLVPVIDQIVAPDEGRSAFERLESGTQFGKIVVSWS